MIKKILAEDIKKSLFIEFYCGRKIVPSYFLTENKYMLCEKHGIIPNMDEYIDIFLNFINTLKFTEKKQTVILTKNIWKNVENCFFKDVKLTINYCKSDKPNVTGVFYVNKNKLKKRKLPLLSGSFNIFVDRYEIEEYTSSIFAHELTHAYEEFKRIENGSESIFDYARRIGYTKNTDRIYSSDSIKQAILNLVYYTTNFEIRAYVASIYGTLKKKY